MSHFYNSQIRYWEDLGYLRLFKEECYSNWLKKEIKKVSESAKRMYKDGFNTKYRSKYKMDFNFLRKFTIKLIADKNLINALYFAIFLNKKKRIFNQNKRRIS